MSIQNTSPLVTIIIPTYNRISLVRESIESVRAQTYKNWELIIVDDGSTDGTAEAIKKIEDERIHIIELIHSGHIGRLLNIGAAHAKGEWLTFLGSDDVWLRHKLQLQIDALKKSGKKWCYGNFELMNESKTIIPWKAGTFTTLSGTIIEQVLTTNAAITICSVMVQRKLFNELGGFENDSRLIYRGDYELILRLALAAEVISLPDVLVHVREHAGRITNSLIDPHERSALPYKFFIDLKPIKKLKKIARNQHAYHMAMAAKNNFSRKKYLHGFQQLGKALFEGDKWQHVLSCFYHGIAKSFTKNI